MKSIALSVVMPFFKRLDELRRVLPLNLARFAREDQEVVVVMDAPDGMAELVSLAKSYPSIHWRILVNENDHPWRSPTKALNVGIRHARGEIVLVVSPESALVTDGPAIARRLIGARPDTAVAGWVRFGTFDELERCGGSTEQALEASGAGETERRYYGSIAARRDRFEAIGGYDEDIEGWGGDDDNLRVRLAQSGCAVDLCDEVKVLHLSSEPRGAINKARHRPPPAERVARTRRIFHPASHVANPGGWGRDFDRVVLDWCSP